MSGLFPTLEAFLRGASTEPAGDRLPALRQLAAFLRVNRARPASLVFVCTHNSRRSQLAQALASAWAAGSGLDHLVVRSAGTERTACHPNSVAALQRAGFEVEPAGGDAANPRYQLGLGGGVEGPVLHSKLLEAAMGGPSPRAAVMVCSRADAGCPVVPGADLRVSLPYEDPKARDGLAGQDEAYDSCARRISAELGWAFRRAAAG